MTAQRHQPAVYPVALTTELGRKIESEVRSIDAAVQFWHTGTYGGLVDTKLTLKLDRGVIERTKQYAEERGVSLSEMVETYFAGLTRDSAARREPTGIVAELAGIARDVTIDDSAESYANYLAAKYA